MHDETVLQSQTQGDSVLFSGVRRMVRNWLARRKLRRLEALDDYLLSDIGLTRDDLFYALRLPAGVDPVAEMAKIREQRIRRGTKTG